MATFLLHSLTIHHLKRKNLIGFRGREPHVLRHLIWCAVENFFPFKLLLPSWAPSLGLADGLAMLPSVCGSKCVSPQGLVYAFRRHST